MHLLIHQSTQSSIHLSSDTFMQSCTDSSIDPSRRVASIPAFVPRNVFFCYCLYRNCNIFHNSSRTGNRTDVPSADCLKAMKFYARSGHRFGHELSAARGARAIANRTAPHRSPSFVRSFAHSLAKDALHQSTASITTAASAAAGSPTTRRDATRCGQQQI